MAIEAQHMNLLPSRLIRDFKVNSHMLNNTQMMDCGVNFASDNNLVPLYQSSVCVPVKTTESGLTYHVPTASGQRKRTRDYFDNNNNLRVPQKAKLPSSSFMDHELILQHQSEIDRVVAQHAEKVRLEVEERRKQESEMLVQEIYRGMQKRVEEKEEEMQRIGKLNWALQERVKRLYVENQIWRDLAQSNEATANTLRANLEHLLAQERHAGDAESCCGSTAGDDVRKCRKCGSGDSSVLVLPCRHLCLCTLCASTLHTCPVCDSPMNATVHVNMSSI